MPLNILVCPPTIFDKFTPVFPFNFIWSEYRFHPTRSLISPCSSCLIPFFCLSSPPCSFPLSSFWYLLSVLIYPGMIQDIIFRVIPSLSFFVILPLLLYILLVYSCLPDAVPHLSTVVGPNYHPPVLSITLLPHATLFSTELHCLRLFLVPLPATRLSHYVCIPSCSSVVSFRPSVCVCPSAFLLPRLVTCLHYVYNIIYQSDFDY